MTATALSLVQTTRKGVRYDNAAVATDNVNGNSIPNDGNVVLMLINGTGAQTVTVASIELPDGTNLAAPSLSIPLTASQSVVTSTFPPSVYGSTLNITSTAATVTIVPLHLASS